MSSIYQFSLNRFHYRFLSVFYRRGQSEGLQGHIRSTSFSTCPYICLPVSLSLHPSSSPSPSASFLSACLPVSDSSCAGIHLAGNSLSWLAVFSPDSREAESWRIRKQLLSCLSPAFCSQLPTLHLRGDAERETEREKREGGVEESSDKSSTEWGNDIARRENERKRKWDRKLMPESL